MGFYRDRILPRLLEATSDTAEYRLIRSRVCRPLAGNVVEIGFGTGLNLPHLPAAVTRLEAVEPSALSLRLAAGRIAACPAEVVLAGADGEHLPFADASADAVLCTWTLCTIPDPVRALREVRRVLRPGAALHFVEHGRAPQESVRRWQRRLDGMQRRVAGGCSLTRDVPGMIEAGGLAVRTLASYYSSTHPRPFGAMYEGTATLPG